MAVETLETAEGGGVDAAGDCAESAGDRRVCDAAPGVNGGACGGVCVGCTGGVGILGLWAMP